MFNKLKNAVKGKNQPQEKKPTVAERKAQREQMKINEAHNEFLKANLEQAKTIWKQLVTEMNDLGYDIKPVIEPAMIPGMYQGLINLKGMTPEVYDRHLNPEKWVKIDEERKAETEKRQKEAEAAMKKEQAEKDAKASEQTTDEPAKKPEETKK